MTGEWDRSGRVHDGSGESGERVGRRVRGHPENENGWTYGASDVREEEDRNAKERRE